MWVVFVQDGGVPAGEEDAAEYDEEVAEKEGQPTPAGEEPIELWDDEEGDEDVQEQGEGPEAEFGGDLDDEVDEEEGAQLPDDEVDEEEDAQLRELLEAGEEEPDLQGMQINIPELHAVDGLWTKSSPWQSLLMPGELFCPHKTACHIFPAGRESSAACRV